MTATVVTTSAALSQKKRSPQVAGTSTSPLTSSRQAVTHIWYSPQEHLISRSWTLLSMLVPVRSSSFKADKMGDCSGRTATCSFRLTGTEQTPTNGGSRIVLWSKGNTFSIETCWTERLQHPIAHVLVGNSTPNSICESVATISWSVVIHQSTSLGSEHFWCRKAPSCRNSLRKEARTKVQ